MYKIVKNFLTAEEHAELNAECESLTKKASVMARNTHHWVLNEPFNPCKLNGAMTYSPVFAKLGRNPILVAEAREWLGCEEIDTYISKFFPMMPRKGFSVGWHQDNHYIQADPSKMVSCDVFVNGARRENGCLRVVPNSHHNLHPHNSSSHGGIFQWLDHAGKSIDIEDDEPFAVFFHLNLIHGCYRNKSLDHRFSVAWEYKVRDYLPASHRNHISQDVLKIC